MASDDGRVRVCPECGASSLPLSCLELFERLLALDHQQVPPWGPLHGVAVSCFFLQHPAAPKAPASGGDAQWTMLQRYLTGGLPAVEAFVARARQRNSHRHSGTRSTPEAGRTGGTLRLTDPQDQVLPHRLAPRRYGTTIVDVAVDGSFPAEGYEDRVVAWARSTVTAWTAAR